METDLIFIAACIPLMISMGPLSTAVVGSVGGVCVLLSDFSSFLFHYLLQILLLPSTHITVLQLLVLFVSVMRLQGLQGHGHIRIHLHFSRN